MSLLSPYGDSGRVGVCSVTSTSSGVPYTAALDVLLVGVQGALHRDPGVLEPGEMDDPGDVVLAQGAGEQVSVEDRAAHERDTRRHEGGVPRREVVDHDGREAGILQRAHDV